MCYLCSCCLKSHYIYYISEERQLYSQYFLHFLFMTGNFVFWKSALSQEGRQFMHSQMQLGRGQNISPNLCFTAAYTVDTTSCTPAFMLYCPGSRSRCILAGAALSINKLYKYSTPQENRRAMLLDTPHCSSSTCNPSIFTHTGTRSHTHIQANALLWSQPGSK